MYGTSRLSPRTREFLVQESMRIGVSVAARQVGASRRTVYRWRRRAGVYVDRSSRPHRSPQRTPDELEATVLALRLDQRWGPDRIAGTLGMHASTIHRILRRHHVERLSHVFPKPPRSIGRFDVREPGELIALDTKKLGRLDRGGGRRAEHRRSLAPVGWRHLHVAIDLASRLVYTELRPGEGNLDTTAFVDAACAFFDRQGIRVRRVLTDNGRLPAHVPGTLPAPRRATHPHQAATPVDERPGRALHRHDPTRMSVRRRLLHERGRARPCHLALARLLQLGTTAHRTRRTLAADVATSTAN